MTEDLFTGFSSPTIRGLLEYAAENYGDKDCIKWLEDGKIITRSYNRQRDDSINAAKDIYEKTGRRRMHIAILGKTGYSFLNYLNGIFVCGSIAVPLGENTPPEEIHTLTMQADCDAIIFDDSTEENVVKAFEAEEKQLIFIKIPEEAPTDIDVELPPVNPMDCAMIMFTSGTTGKKKGVMLSSYALISNVCFKEMSYKGEHVALNVLPMHHIFCFSCDYLKNLKDGVTICLAGDASQLYQSFLTFEPTFVRLVPMITEGLIRKIRIKMKRQPELTARQAGEQVFGRRLRSIISSGARLDAEKAQLLEDAGVSIRQGYGMTETGPRIAVPNGKTDVASAGAVISICETRIENGELQVKSPSLMMGYYKDEEETEKVFTKDGWFRTGDTAVITEDRLLYITGRVKNLIILSNGENISPEEIEQKLAESDYIREVVVYGENDRIFAEIYPDPEMTANMADEEIDKELNEIIALYNSDAQSEKMIAKYIKRNEPFEKTSSGKIKRNITVFDGGKVKS